jgi:hypothetical protein
MAIKLSVGPRFDTRGLPEGYDPHKLYEYRHDTFQPANGLEAFVYKLMPISMIKSVAFAIDPTYRFKVSGHIVTPTNRDRTRSVASVLDVRTKVLRVYDHSYAHTPNFGGISFCWSPTLLYQNLYTTTINSALASQPALSSHIKDTTRRTRLFGSDDGELEIFKADVISTPRTFKRERTLRGSFTGTYPPNPACDAVGGTAPEGPYGQDTTWTYTIEGHSAVFSKVNFDNLASSEVSFNKALALKNAVSMLKGVNPSRDYSLTRNAIELRDLPRSVLQLKDTMENLRKIFDTFGRSNSTRDLIFDLKRSSKDIPSEWLSYHFGWRQTYNDLVELLALPEKITNKINFLMRRSQKATTFRSKRQFVTGASGVSGFEYVTEAYPYEFNAVTSSRIERESEVRLVVNATIDFPTINVPSLVNTSIWYDRAGITPRFIDVYNLTPWTWLFDWFTGCGNYLELMEEINHDSSLINYGFFTVHTKGKVISDFYSESLLEQETRVDNTAATVITISKNRHQSRLEYECTTRQDVAALYDGVKRTSVPSSLTAYQHSILGAILAQRSGFTRKDAFKPRS